MKKNFYPRAKYQPIAKKEFRFFSSASSFLLFFCFSFLLINSVQAISCTAPTVNLGSDVVQCGGSVTLDAGVGYYTGGADQSQLSNITGMASFSQTNLAQSFIPSQSTICGASIYLTATGSGTDDITIQLYSNLPNAGGVLLATGTATGVAPGGVATVSWTSVNVTPGTTYYLVFTSTNGTLTIGGDTGNPYAGGQVYANSGYNSYPTYDYTFQTYSCTPNTYLWSTGATTQTISVSTTGAYSVTVNSGGCTASDVVNVGISPVPSVNLGNDVTKCGGSVTLNAGAGTTGGVDQSQLTNTTSMAGFSQTNLAQSFVPSQSTICGASIYLTSGGSGTGDITIQLFDNLPNAGGNLLASGTATGVPSGGVATVSWNGVNVVPGTSYYLVFTSTNSSLFIAGDINNPYAGGQVYANSGYSSFPSYDYTFQTFYCGNVYSYAWSTEATTQSITASGTGNYQVTVTNNFGCSAADDIHVAINPVPSVSLTNPPAQCGGTVTLDAGVGYSVGGADQSQLSTATGGMASFGQPDLAQSFVPSQSTICGASIYLISGGSGTGDITIQLYSNLPNAGGVLLASGTVIGVSPGGVATVSWASVNITPGTTYYLVFTSTNSTLLIGGDTGNPYAGGQVYANSGYSSFPTFDYAFQTYSCALNTYQWSNGPTSQTNTVSSLGTYTVTVSNTASCTATASAVVTINPIPTVNLGNDVTQCGGTVTLDAGTYTSYLWSNSSTAQTLTTSSTGTYSVVVTNSNNCTASDTVSVTINTKPTATLTLSPDSVCASASALTLSGGTPSGGNYFGTNVSGGSFTPSTPGTSTIHYAYTDANSCSDTASADLVVYVCTGVKEITSAKVSLFPNPSSNDVFIKIDGALSNVQIEIFDAAGKLIESSKENSSTAITHHLDVSKYSSGTYLARIKVGNETGDYKISVQR